MSRIIALDPNVTTGKTAVLLTSMKYKLGAVPNLMRTLAHSPAALEGFLGFKATLGTGVLSPRVREQIALLIAEINGCDYWLAAHSVVGKMTGLGGDDLIAARRGEATDPKVDALLKFVAAVVRSRGQIADDALTTAREAGVSDAEAVEAVAHVALNILTNYTNHVAQPVVDFPSAAPLPAAV